MAVKSIFEVEIDRDGAFRRFAADYGKFEKSLRSLPEAWKQVNEKVKGTRAEFSKMVDGMVAANVQTKLRLRAQQEANRLTQEQLTVTQRLGSSWDAVERTTGRLAVNLRSITGSLLKWGTITGVAGGLLGVGGLFGLDRLAGDVAGRRRTSLGLGTSYGAPQAFAANFARFVDPASFLADVAEARLDITKRVGLIGAGLTRGELAGDTTDTAVALLRHLKQIADTTDPALYAQVIGARRLPTTAQELQRLRGTSAVEFASLVRGFHENRGAFNIPDDVVRKWQELTTTLTRAGQGIENTFVRGLAPLAPALGHLSESFEKVVRAFLASPMLEHWIAASSDALERFAKFIGTDEFQDDVKGFVDGLSKIVSAIGTFLSWFSSKTGTTTTGPEGAAPHPRVGHGMLLGPILFGEDKVGPRFSGGYGGGYVPPVGLDKIVAGLVARGFTPGQAAAIAGNLGAESGFRPEAINPESGAFGLEQLLGSRKSGFFAFAAATGRSPYDREAQLDWLKLERTGESVKYGGSDERAAYDKAFAGGDVSKMTASFGAYVERPSASDLASSMAKRQAFAAAAAKMNADFAKSAVERKGAAADPKYTTGPFGNTGYVPTVVTIENNTGGSAVVSVNGLKN
jgi:hypothetical protein